MKGHVNSSGFPLQIAIEHHVDESSNAHGWRTRYTEHSWRNNESGESGFIDLVLENQYRTQFLVVECKRVQDTSWIFLVEGIERKPRRHAKCFLSNKTGSEIKRFEWLDVTLEPSTPQSQYCVVQGTDNRSRSLIERSAAELVSATEALALEDRSLSQNESDDLKIYFNVIVTTAKLHVCRFDPATISLTDGKLAEASFEETPYIRFRKQLNPIYKLPNTYSPSSGIDIANAKENTVFVVNSEKLLEFLREFEIDDGYSNSRHWR